MVPELGNPNLQVIVAWVKVSLRYLKKPELRELRDFCGSGAPNQYAGPPRKSPRQHYHFIG